MKLAVDSSLQPTSGAENGRKRIREAASIRNYIVNKRLKLVGDGEFVYHMNNQCYKTYTLKKTLDRISKAPADNDAAEDIGLPQCHVRSKSTHRPKPTAQCGIYSQKCVICGFVKHK